MRLWSRKPKINLVPSSEQAVKPLRHNIPDDADNRVVYVCGPHGSGKSTLIEDLKASSLPISTRDQLGHMESLQDNLSRQVWRISLHAIEHRENLSAATDPRLVILGDRCYLDDESYVSAFVSMGWISTAERKKLLLLSKDIYTFLEIRPPRNFIILLPPISWNVERIMTRWNNGEPVKWQETDFNYLAHTLDAYRITASALTSNPRVLVLTETDRQERVQRIRQWLDKAEFISGYSWVEGKERQQKGWGDST